MQRRELFLLIVATVLAVGGFLIPISNPVFWNRIAGPGIHSRFGFPLDDAWIHQTYARNLSLRGEWAFVPGKPSGGSTAPLWTILLVPAHFVFRDPFLWTYFLGALGLLGLGIIGETLFRYSGVPLTSRLPWVGIYLIGEWHMVWAALSGMETILFSLIITTVFWLLLSKTKRWLLIGILIGVSVWVRPDGITLIGPAGLALLYEFLKGKTAQLKSFLQAVVMVVFGFLMAFLPYLIFNAVLTGQWWPNTFYAKQAEYAVLREANFAYRLLRLLALPMIGAGILLLPGFIYGGINGIRKGVYFWLAGVAWCLGYISIYAVRLPVTYQHGRYLMPAMPIYFVLGLVGTRQLFLALPINRIRFILKNSWTVGTAVVWLGFYFMGMRAFSTDVAIIETEMVQVAKWVAAELPDEASIAAHDIGALGYFGQHELVDLAGLVSPEVIPFIRNESLLADYLDQRGVEYLITFPSWYPELVKGRRMVYTSGGEIAPKSGGENMQVFEW